MDQTLVALASSGDDARRGSRVEAVLMADGGRERARAVRRNLVAVLAALGLPLWLMAAWPGSFSSDLRLFSATIWVLGAAAVAWAAAREWRWSRARSRHLARLGPLPALRSPPAPGAACVGPSDEED